VTAGAGASCGAGGQLADVIAPHSGLLPPRREGHLPRRQLRDRQVPPHVGVAVVSALAEHACNLGRRKVDRPSAGSASHRRGAGGPPELL